MKIVEFLVFKLKIRSVSDVIIGFESFFFLIFEYLERLDLENLDS